MNAAAGTARGRFRLAVLSMHTSPRVLPGSGDGGGMNVYVREMSSALGRAGVDCDVFTRSTSPADPPVVTIEPGYRVHYVPAGPQAAVDKEALVGLVPAFARAVGERWVGTPDAIHAHYWLSAAAGVSLAELHNIPLLCTFHTLARIKTASGDPEPRVRADAEELIVQAADRCLVSCEQEAEELAHWYRARPDSITVVTPGVDHAVFSPGSRLGARHALGWGDGPVVLFVGRIQALKGLDLAIRALARLRDNRVRLVVVGGPSGREGVAEMDRLRALAVAESVSDRIQWTAPMGHVELSTMYRAADVVVIPSRSESFGLVALEAAACGKAVVAAAVGGLRSIVVDGVTGRSVEGRDPGVWADAIDGILGDPQRAASWGRYAAERARPYTWRQAAGRVRREIEMLTRVDA